MKIKKGTLVLIDLNYGSITRLGLVINVLRSRDQGLEFELKTVYGRMKRKLWKEVLVPILQTRGEHNLRQILKKHHYKIIKALL